MLKKITESDINGLGVVGLADTPGLSATDMQEKFEEISKSAIIPKFNQLIDDLEALNIYQKVDSVEGKGLSTNDYTNEDKETLYSAKGKIDETVKIFGKSSINFGRKSDSVIGDKSTALGADNTASGNYSDAFGNGNVSSGLASHSEGANNISSGKYSHAEGNRNEATKDYSHAEGYETKATSLASHSEGQTTNASGTCSHAEGYLTKAFDFSHSEGDSTTASGIGSHAEGSETEASGLNSHSEGKLSVASGKYSHAEGNTTKAIADNSHAEGAFTKVDSSGENGHAEGYGSIVTGACSHAEGINSKAEGSYSHAEGNNTTAKGSGSHSEGAGTIAQGENSHAEGSNTTSSGSSSHAEGTASQASGSYSHAEGAGTVASGDYSHAEGSGTKAIGSNAHAEGSSTQASGNYSHAEGSASKANGVNSHAEGGATVAAGECQHVQGKFNVEDTDGAYAHIVGGGTSDTDRKNIHTLDWQGNAVFSGNVTDGNGDSIALLKTESGHSLELNIDENYVMTISLLNKSGETISSKAIDFPVESMVVNASYSSGKLTLILQNGNTVDVDVSAIVKGLVNESRTIAGIDLKDDITADELIAALGVDVIKNDVAQLKSDLEAESANSKKAIAELNDKKITKFYANNLGETNLQDSDNGKITDMLIYGKSEQKSYTGKNLAKTVKENWDWGTNELSVGKNCLTEGYKGQRTTYCVNVNEGETYIFGYDTTETKLKYLCWATSSEDDLCIRSGYNYGENIATVTVQSGETKLYIHVLSSSIRANKGEELFDFEPYVGGIPSPNPDYPQEIKSVVNPIVKMCGKNLLNPTLETTTKNGVTCTNNGDGTYTLNGTATGSINFKLTEPSMDLIGKTVKIIGTPSGISDAVFQYSDMSTIGYVDTDGNGKVCVIGNSGLGLSGYISVQEGASLNNVVFKPMITTDTSATYDDFEQYKEQTVALPYTLNAIPVSEGGNVTIDGQQYIADYVDVENKKLHRLVDSSLFDASVSIFDNADWLLSSEEVIDLTDEEVQAFKNLATYYPTTNVFVTSDQLDGYTVFNYPISMENGWNYVKQQIGDTRDYIYDMELQSAEAYVNSEYAVTLTELGV